MTTTEPVQISDLNVALAKAQAEMGAAAKDATNDFANYTYVTLASVYKAIDEALAKQGIFHSQVIHTEENRVGVELRLALGAQELSTPILWLPFDLAKGRSTVQAMGSAITYGRKYQLMGFFGIPQEDDDGSGAGNDTGKGRDRKKATPDITTGHKPVGSKRNYPDLPSELSGPVNRTKTGALVTIGLGPPASLTMKDGDIWIDYDVTPARVLRADGAGHFDLLMESDALYAAAHETVANMLKDRFVADKIPIPDMFDALQEADNAECPASSLSQVSVGALAKVLTEQKELPA